jgi:hypothetical protein
LGQPRRGDRFLAQGFNPGNYPITSFALKGERDLCLYSFVVGTLRMGSPIHLPAPITYYSRTGN